MTTKLIRRRLLALTDEGNTRFAVSLTPGLEPTRVPGCCNPALHALAKGLRKTRPEVVEASLAELPHELHDGDVLHVFLLGLETKPDLVFAKIRRFLPHAKGQTACDALSPKGFTKDLGRLEAEARRQLASEHTYTRHFGICMHMTHFLGEAFHPESLALIGSLDSKKHYVHVAQGWYFATVLAKQLKATLPWLVKDHLSTFVHHKVIQKSIESSRVPGEAKTVLHRVRESLPRRGTGS